MKAEIGKRYKHYKGGEYTVIAVGRLEADPETVCVVYQSEYDTVDYPRGSVWIRNQEDFESTVRVDGREVSRFTQIG